VDLALLAMIVKFHNENGGRLDLMFGRERLGLVQSLEGVGHQVFDPSTLEFYMISHYDQTVD